VKHERDSAALRATAYAAGIVLSSAVVAAIAASAVRGYGSPFDPVVVLSLALGLVGCEEVIRQRLSVRWRTTTAEIAGPENAGTSAFASYYRLRVQLRGAMDDPDQLDRVIAPMVAELIDDLLLRNHGIRRADRPEQARHLLGDELFGFLDSGPRRTLDAEGFDRILKRIEAL